MFHRQGADKGSAGEIALIALGSNNFSPLGDVKDTVQKSSLRIASRFPGDVVISDLFRTPAFPAGSGPDFVNAAMMVRVRVDATALLDFLHQLEAEAGRVRGKRWGPRTLDLDLIAYGDQIAPDRAVHEHWRTLDPAAQATRVPDQMILPHPRLQDRSFVLVPLSQVAPDWVHPILGQSVCEMLAARPASERAEVVALEA